MKITEDIIKALHNCIDAVGSISDFSQQANVNIETVSKYLSRKTKSIRKESWDKLYPMIDIDLSSVQRKMLIPLKDIMDSNSRI